MFRRGGLGPGAGEDATTTASDPLRGGGREKNLRTGVAFALVYTEGGSKLAVANPSLRSLDLREQQPWNFSRLLKVWPGGRGKAGKRLRQRLRRTGRAELKLRIDCATADPTLASSSTEVPLTLRQTPKVKRKPRGARKLPSRASKGHDSVSVPAR